MKQFEIPGWKHILEKAYGGSGASPRDTLVAEAYAHSLVFPREENIFAAFRECPYENLKVVILGQDPYHGAGQATGLAFAVTPGTQLPPSLRNIFTELTSDLGKPLMETKSDLMHWAEQGVLLLNTTLTVLEGKPGSHRDIGWEECTRELIQLLAEKHNHLVFILWGAHAQHVGKDIDRTRHLVLESAHPSPLSAYRGFFGSTPFSKTNDYLIAHGKKPIGWL